MEGVAFDSSAEKREATCHPDTRVDILGQADEWANNPEKDCIFWLQGMAGTGKSTISRTVAYKLADKKALGASFFFKRGEGDRGKAARFFTTIAAQLVCQSPPMAEHVHNAIEAEPSVAEKSVAEQFEKLVLEPLRKVKSNPQTPLRTMVVVVDALDECDREDDVTTIIGLLPKAKQLSSVRLKFFVTSRPEVPIRDEFKEINGSYKDIVLHKVSEPVIEHDISVFLEFRLKDFRDKFNRRDIPERQKLAEDWPGQTKVQRLVKMAIPLFIFAATACRFIEDRRQGGGPDDRLQKILEYQTRNQISSLHATYSPVLDQMLVGLEAGARRDAIDEFKKVVGSIVVLASPLSVVSIACLLGISTAVVDGRLDLLHAVLDIPSDPNAPVKLLHLSFRDFLVDPDKREKNPFWVDERKTHETLAAKCLKLLSEGNHLTQDICRLQMPGKRREDVDKRTIDRCLPPEFQYACLYWIYHLKESEGKVQDGDQADQFLRRHFLHWLEALSLMGKMSESIALIGMLQAVVAVS